MDPAPPTAVEPCTEEEEEDDDEEEEDTVTVVGSTAQLTLLRHKLSL